MSVKVRLFKGKSGIWEVDIRLRLPNGKPYRERVKSPASSKPGSLKWGLDRERHLIQYGPEQPKREVPTLEEFAPKFIEGHARANQHKASGIAAKESIIRMHLIPVLGSMRLDWITTEQVQELKRRLADRKPKTVNNALTVLNTMLRKAVEWEVIDGMPCAIRLLGVPSQIAAFHDFREFELLVSSAAHESWRAELVVLLGGEAGLRLGEITALEWSDVDFGKRRLCVQRSEWKGHVTTPKGNRPRHVPVTRRLAEALNKYRHLRGPRVICDEEGRALTPKMIADLVRRAAKRAGLANRGVHVLRHTFCSHLAMRGAPARAIQELAGHQELATSQRYMHMSPTAVEAAIRLLDSSGVPSEYGEMMETLTAETGSG